MGRGEARGEKRCVIILLRPLTKYDNRLVLIIIALIVGNVRLEWNLNLKNKRTLAIIINSDINYF